MFDQLSAEIPASLIKGFLTTTRTRTTTTTTKQNVDPAVHFVYSRVKIIAFQPFEHKSGDLKKIEDLCEALELLKLAVKSLGKENADLLFSEKIVQSSENNSSYIN
jgi:hypothetical protein